MRSKYYISTKEDKVGTVFAVSRYSNDEYKQSIVSKINSNGTQAFEDIVKYIIKNDTKSSIMTFKFKDIDTVKYLGNKFNKDEEFIQMSKDSHCLFQVSPVIFKQDKDGINKSQNELESYLILREHYHREGKV